MQTREEESARSGEAVYTNARKGGRGTERKDSASSVHRGEDSLPTAQWMENISIPSYYATLFFISVRLVSYIQGNIWGGVMFLGVQLTGKQKLEVPNKKSIFFFSLPLPV